MNNSGQDIDDLILIQGYLAGDDEQFAILYERYRKLLYNYLNRLLGGDRSRADDLFQQCWIKVIDQLPKYKHRQQFSAWLLRIAHNLAIDYFRKNSRNLKVEAGSLDDEDNHYDAAEANGEPWRNMHRSELEAAIDKAVATLSPELREVFLLRRENVSFKEIAQIQKSPLNTVLARMQYALKKLRKELAEWKA